MVGHEDKRSRIIILTGGIGSGKSVVARILRLNGFPVYDCDAEARRLMENDRKIVDYLIHLLGSECYLQTGKLNSQYVGMHLFGNADIREKINTIVHKAVKVDFALFCKNQKGLIFCETAIPITSGLVEVCDEIWLVEADESVRVERVIKRNGLDEEQVRKRIESQNAEFVRLPLEKTVVINNNENSSLLLNIVKDIGKDIKYTYYLNLKH